MSRLILTVVVGACLAASSAQAASPIDMDKFLDCLWAKEASRQLTPKDGDGGQAIGPYQIHWSYWKDATDFDKSIGGTYQDCRKKAYAEKIVRAYMRRWLRWSRLPKTYENMARIHNGGGPRARRTHKEHRLWVRATTGYWQHTAFSSLRK